MTISLYFIYLFEEIFFSASLLCAQAGNNLNQIGWNARSVARSTSVRRSARSTWSVSRQKL
ncbi:MAG: hypothetical protein DMG06_27985 [Acidobacteria bacterium]|nr:MAG: hypothetical protein DMG06_27985 [Acidobacteriota bacterium]